MTKNVVTKTFADVQDHGGGNFRVGPPPVVTGHPRVALNANNPNFTALVADYPTSAQRTHNENEVTADYSAYNQWQLAMGYVMDGNTTVGNDAVAKCDAIVVAHENAIAAFVATGDDSGFDTFGVAPFDNWLYANLLLEQVSLTFDWCYDLLSETQRTRWYNVVMQVAYALFQPTDIVFHDGGSSRVFAQNPWAAGASPWITSNYYHHHLLGLVCVGLVFEGETPITLSMQGGNVDLSGDYFLNLLTTREMPVIETTLAKLVGGGSMEGTNYGLSLSDVFFAKSLYEWTKGTDLFTNVSSYLEDTARWRMHMGMPVDSGTGERDYTFIRGAMPNNAPGQLSDFHHSFLINALGAYPTLTEAGALKRMLGELGDLTPSSHFYQEGYRFLHGPTIAGVTEAANFDTVPLIHSAAVAGDIFARSDWNSNSATAIALASGEHHNGSHTHGDVTALQVWKNGWLFGNMQMNSTSTDGDFNSAATFPNALDRADKKLASLVAAGDIFETYPDGNSRFTNELNGFTPDTLYVEDNTATTGEIYIVIDATPTYQSHTTGQRMTLMRREIVFFPANDAMLVFDRLITTTSQPFTIQFTPPNTPIINGNSFIVDNGVSDAEVTLLTHSATWTNTVLTDPDPGSGPTWFISTGDGPNATRAVVATGTDVSIVSGINIDSGVNSFVLDDTTAGELEITITMADLSTKVVTFYEAQTHQYRSIV